MQRSHYFRIYVLTKLSKGSENQTTKNIVFVAVKEFYIYSQWCTRGVRYICVERVCVTPVSDRAHSLSASLHLFIYWLLQPVDERCVSSPVVCLLCVSLGGLPELSAFAWQTRLSLSLQLGALRDNQAPQWTCDLHYDIFSASQCPCDTIGLSNLDEDFLFNSLLWWSLKDPILISIVSAVKELNDKWPTSFLCSTGCFQDPEWDQKTLTLTSLQGCGTSRP